VTPRRTRTALRRRRHLRAGAGSTTCGLASAHPRCNCESALNTDEGVCPLLLHARSAARVWCARRRAAARTARPLSPVRCSACHAAGNDRTRRRQHKSVHGAHHTRSSAVLMRDQAALVKMLVAQGAWHGAAARIVQHARERAERLRFVAPALLRVVRPRNAHTRKRAAAARRGAALRCVRSCAAQPCADQGPRGPSRLFGALPFSFRAAASRARAHAPLPAARTRARTTLALGHCGSGAAARRGFAHAARAASLFVGARRTHRIRID
jgi:hypothetical protein